MKKLTLILTFVAFYSLCYSQEIIELNFNFDKRQFNEKTESIEFHAGETYKIKINGINTSIIGYKIKSKAYTLTSAIPEIIKPIFPGITEVPVLETSDQKHKADSFRNDLCSKSEEKYKKLCLLKKESDLLYKYTKTEVDTKKADSVRIKILDVFDTKSIDDLKWIVNIDSKYIIVAQEICKKSMEEYPDDNTIDQYNRLSCIVDTVKSRNYPLYITFIENSLKAKNYIEYAPFKAEKDIVDLNITFIDSYAKDTIYNSSISFYTSRNICFSFSTGFFYNNLHEKSYYIEKRDSLKNNVLQENNSTFDFSIGALGHLSYKVTNWFKLGISMGAALSPLDGKTRYMIGGSMLFFRKNQLELNGGLVLAKMKVLSGSVKNDVIGKYVPASVTTVPIFEKIQSGFYIGLTYNLISTKK